MNNERELSDMASWSRQLNPADMTSWCFSPCLSLSLSALILSSHWVSEWQECLQSNDRHGPQNISTAYQIYWFHFQTFWVVRKGGKLLNTIFWTASLGKKGLDVNFRWYWNMLKSLGWLYTVKFSHNHLQVANSMKHKKHETWRNAKIISRNTV